MELPQGRASAEYESEGDLLATDTTVMKRGSGHPLFTVRPAHERSQGVGTSNVHKDLSSLLNFFEGGASSDLPEGKRQQSSQGAVRETDSAVKNVGTNGQTTADHRSNQPGTQKHNKVTEDRAPVRLTSILRQEKQGSELSLNSAAVRGRAELRRGYGSNRSKSADWGVELSEDRKTGDQSLWKGNKERRSESLERAVGKQPGVTSALDKSHVVSNGVLPSFDACTSDKMEEREPLIWSFHNSDAAPRLNKDIYQSLPTRIKSGRSGAGKDRKFGQSNQNHSFVRCRFGSGSTELEMSSKTPSKSPGILSISDRIEKLYGLSNTDTDASCDKNDSVRKYLLHTKQRPENHRPTNNTEWVNVPYKGQKGGTFPRRHFGEEVCSEFLRNRRNEKDAFVLNKDSALFESKVSSSTLVQPRGFGATSDGFSPSSKSAPLQNQARFLKEDEEQGGGSSEQEEKKIDVMLSEVNQEQSRKRLTEGKMAKDEDSCMSQPSKNTVMQKSPTLWSCKTLEMPPQEPTFMSKEVKLAAGDSTREVKQTAAYNLCNKVDTNTDENEEDVFKAESQPMFEGKIPELVTMGNEPSFNSVQSKILKFEKLAQNSQMSTFPRRAFSAPEQFKGISGGCAIRNSSYKVLNGQNVKEDAGNQGFREHHSYKEGGEKQEKLDGWITRSFSMVEVEENMRNNLEVSHTSRADIRSHGTLNRNLGEQYSSKDNCKDLKNAIKSEQGSKDLNSKYYTSLDETQKKNGGDVISNKSYSVKEQNIPDSANASLCTKDQLPSSSKSFYGDARDSKPHNISMDCASERDLQVSKNTQNITGSILPPFSNLLQVHSIPSIPNTLSLVSDPSPLLSRSIPNASVSDRQPANLSDFTEQDGTSCSFSLCAARWSSDEESDDDSTQKNEDSIYDSDSAESSVTITSNMSQSDRKSFSVTLADLCNFGGVDYADCDSSFLDVDSEDYTSLQRCASLGSDVSALSSVSILSTDELERLVTDVRSLGDETLQNYEDIQVVVLHKEVGSGLGFTVAGGTDQNKPITIHKVFPGGLAAQEGSIQEGDRVLSINGTAFETSAHWEALRTLRRARSRGMAVVVLQKDGVAKPQKIQRQHSEEQLDLRRANIGCRKLKVVLNKCSSDLGFSLEGGQGSSQGDMPIIVKKVFQGGPVNVVLPGDELLEIQGHSLQGLHRLQAWNLIKKLPPGPVQVLLNRTV